MTATAQPHRPLTRWATAPIRALRHLYQQLLAAGEATARTNRFLQPRPQAAVEAAKQAHPATVSKLLAGSDLR